MALAFFKACQNHSCFGHFRCDCIHCNTQRLNLANLGSEGKNRAFIEMPASFKNGTFTFIASETVFLLVTLKLSTKNILGAASPKCLRSPVKMQCVSYRGVEGENSPLFRF